ncbi:hypothetical protein [Lacrimispora sp.]
MNTGSFARHYATDTGFKDSGKNDNNSTKFKVLERTKRSLSKSYSLGDGK